MSEPVPEPTTVHHHHNHDHAHHHGQHQHGDNHQHSHGGDDFAVANAQHFNEHGAKGFEEHPFAKELTERQAAAYLAAYPFDEEKTALMDFACGPGLVSRELASHTKQIVGVDITQNFVDEFNKRVSDQGISPEEMKFAAGKLFQHIDVTEINGDPTGQTLNGQLQVDSKHIYADLDELIVNHVQAMARKVEELMAHDRFKAGSEDELHIFLKNHLAANPTKSMYGFALNRKRPGHFNLSFLANKQSAVQTWPVRVTPEAYYLFEAPAPGVPELCDAFKVRHLHESQNAANAQAGGKTPYAGRTPARPGHATPGHFSVRQPARTPNPYGGTTPFSGAPTPQSQYGYQTPRPPGGYPPPGQPSTLPAGMNPERAAMIQNSNGWGQGGGGW
ncbi:hypothetical protein ONZ45_g17395 [Pleurotus djamor]|nr:hypothetical protein ONZ45_g17395 [Pleurotus djamor]